MERNIDHKEFKDCGIGGIKCDCCRKGMSLKEIRTQSARQSRRTAKSSIKSELANLAVDDEKEKEYDKDARHGN
jgi:hypothetical protein